MNAQTQSAVQTQGFGTHRTVAPNFNSFFQNDGNPQGGAAANELPKYPFICVTQSLGRIVDSCSISQRLRQQHGNAECFMRNKNCGVAAIDAKGGGGIGGKYLLVGPFCENHYMNYMNVCMRNIVDCSSRIIFCGVNYRVLPNNGRQPLPLYPLWCAQPINSSREFFLDMFENSPIGRSVDRENLATILSLGTHSVGGASFSAEEQIILQKLITYGQKYTNELIDYLSCWKDTVVNLYFTTDYLAKNVKSNKWLHDMAAACEKKTILGTDLNQPANEKYVWYEVNITLLPICDMLLVKTFLASKYIRPDGRVDQHVPNVQIIDGKFTYGTGFGLQNELLSDRKYIINHIYDDPIMDVVSDRALLSNVHVMYLDMVTRSPKLSLFRFKNHVDVCDTNLNDLHDIYSQNL